MKALRITLILAVAWVTVAYLLAVQFWPHLPQTARQWAVFVGVGSPLYVAPEGAFGWLFSRRHGEAISTKQFSISRILIALLVAVPTVGACWWLSSRLVGE